MVAFRRMMYIFFCGVVPVCTIFAFVVYYIRNGQSFNGKRKPPPNTYVSRQSAAVISYSSSRAALMSSSLGAGGSGSSSGGGGSGGEHSHTHCALSRDRREGLVIGEVQLVSSTNTATLRKAPEIPRALGSAGPRHVLIADMRLVSSTNPALLNASTELHL